MPDGRFEGKVFIWPVRVYYDDTDAGGVVYHANYLKFAERARTEMLRALGVEHSGSMAAQGLVFVVKRCEIDYIRPALLDDALDVTLHTTKVGGASLEGWQEIVRGEEVLATIRIRLGCVDTTGKPGRLPGDVRAQMGAFVTTKQQ